VGSGYRKEHDSG
jgi:hypothetical protein